MSAARGNNDASRGNAVRGALRRVSNPQVEYNIGWESAKPENFGNARDVRKLLDAMQGHKSNRQAKIIDSLPDNDPALIGLKVGLRDEERGRRLLASESHPLTHFETVH